MATTVLRRGERVHIRHPRPGDRDDFVEAVVRSRRLHHPWVAPPNTSAAFDDYVRRSRRPSRAAFLICRNEAEAITGVANLGEIIHGPFQSAFLGYWIGAPYARQGYMTEALHHAFTTLGLHRVEANIIPINRASIALVKRAGFRREGYSVGYLKIAGRWSDHQRWALLAEDWRNFQRGKGA